MTPNTMTLDEVRDELARRDRWLFLPACPRHPGFKWRWWRFTIDAIDGAKEWRVKHPHPATLDGAAAALLTEYVWGRYIDDRETENGWYAWKRAYYNSSLHMHNTDDEILARYRLALACRIAEEGK